MADRSHTHSRSKARSEKDAKEHTEASTDEAESSKVNGEVAPPDQSAACPPVEPLELPPFETIAGDRIDPLVFKFQFKNVEYSSGRNKTLLCYLVDRGNCVDGLMRGYLEDEHAATHAEEVFFTQCLNPNDPALTYTVTWYVSSSPCSDCAAKITEVLKTKKNVKLSIFASRLLDWEEEENRRGLRSLKAAGCKLRVMKPLDFSYTWDTFVENEDQVLNLWEDCKDNYEFYHEKLDDILQ